MLCLSGKSEDWDQQSLMELPGKTVQTRGDSSWNSRDDDPLNISLTVAMTILKIGNVDFLVPPVKIFLGISAVILREKKLFLFPKTAPDRSITRFACRDGHADAATCKTCAYEKDQK